MSYRKQIEDEAMAELKRDYGPRHTPGWIVPAFIVGSIVLSILGDWLINH